MYIGVPYFGKLPCTFFVTHLRLIPIQNLDGPEAHPFVDSFRLIRFGAEIGGASFLHLFTPKLTHPSYEPKSELLQGGYIGDYIKTSIGDTKGDTRSLDCSSYGFSNARGLLTGVP